MKKEIIVTGIRPTSSLTIANLIGSVFPLLGLQNKTDLYDIYVFVATLHGLTDSEPNKVFNNAKEIVKDYLALGLDPEKITIYDQYDIREEVLLLTAYLDRLVTVAKVLRLPTLKEKLRSDQSSDESNLLLLNYPIMMASDILLQNGRLVPVGKDQYPHIELVRDVTKAFNKKYGEALILCRAMTEGDPVNILSLRGEGKMSKSKPENAIFLTDSPEEIRAKIKKAETGNPGEITEKIESLLLIANTIDTDTDYTEIIDQHKNGEKVMGEFKKMISESVIGFCDDFQRKRSRIPDGYVKMVLKKGAVVAKFNAKLVIQRVEEYLINS